MTSLCITLSDEMTLLDSTRLHFDMNKIMYHYNVIEFKVTRDIDTLSVKIFLHFNNDYDKTWFLMNYKL